MNSPNRHNDSLLVMPDERGSILVMTCATLAVVVILVGTISFATGIEVTSADNAVAELKNSQAMLSSLEIAKKLFLARPRSGEDSLDNNPRLQWQCGDVEVTITFRDEERKLNIKSLTDNRGKIDIPKNDELARLLWHFLEEPEAVLSRLNDYADPDSEGRFELDAKNEPLDTVDELLLIEGINANVFFGDPANGKGGLRDTLTLDSTDRININTASAEVLMCLSNDIDESTAQHIIESRKVRPFSRPYDLVKEGILSQNEYNKIGKRLTSAGSTYTVLIEAKSGRCIKRCEVLLEKRGSGAEVATFREVRQ